MTSVDAFSRSLREAEPGFDELPHLFQRLPNVFSESVEHHRSYWSHRLYLWLDQWQELSGARLPRSVAEACNAFRCSLLVDTDFDAGQVARFVDRIGGDPQPGLEEWLGATMARFIDGVRPWFPVWSGFVNWLLCWCRHRDYRQVVFLARDSVPLYVLAGQLAARESTDTKLRLLHASRASIGHPEFKSHFERSVLAGEPVALVDTGCYGSLLTRLVRRCRVRCPSEPPAVFYFFSRNPHIFGYMNYLMLAGTIEHGGPWLQRDSLDFVIYAGDVLEGMPKLYRLEELGTDGRPRAMIQDPVSFVLSSCLLEELILYTNLQAAASARQAVHNLYEGYAASRREKGPAPGILYDGVAPKVPPEADYAAAEELLRLPPQGEIFDCRLDDR